MANNLMVAIVGGAGAGKSASLRNIPNQNKWMYLNAEVNKPLPFNHDFKEVVVTSAKQAVTSLKAAVKNDKCEGIIIDTFTALLDMQEMAGKKEGKSDEKENKFAVWDKYRDFILTTFQEVVGACNKPLIVLCHTELTKDVKGRSAIRIAVKGGMKDRGIESFFTNIVYADCVDIEDLEGFENDHLNISETEVDDECKYVLQTRKVGTGVGLNVRQTMGLWDRKEAYIDNDITIVLNKLANN